MANKFEGFGFIGDDDIDHLAFFLLLCELLAEVDDVGHGRYPCLMECFGHGSAFPSHDLVPFGLERMQYAFDGAVGIPKVLFVEFFYVLFLDAVNDSWDTDVGDCLL